MDTISAVLKAVAAFFSWLTGRQDIANQPELRQAKKAQVEQETADRIEKLTKTAMTDPNPAKRMAAAEELRRMDSE